MTMKIKRFISSILTAVLVLSICSVSAFAVTSEDTRNCVVNDDNPFAIVIRDADGNIVETYYQTRTLYVTSTGLSIIFPQAEL